MIRTLTNKIRSLLFHGHLPSRFWAEALATATYLHNLTPTATQNHISSFESLYRAPPSYSHLRTFGCLCYPNTSATARHKLEPRSTRCVFLGYAASHKGYRCLDLVSNRVIISRHVIFDEYSFPFNSTISHPNVPSNDSSIADSPSPIFPQFPPLVVPTSPLSPYPPANLSNSNSTPSHQSQSPTNQPTPSVAPSPATSPPHFSTPLPKLRSPPPSLPHVPTRSPNLANPTSPSTIPSPPPRHPMQTRSKSGIHVPKVQFNLSSDIIPLPKSYKTALQNPQWFQSMQEEFDALINNRTWDLVPRPSHANVVSGKWIFSYLLVYVDDIILTASSSSLLRRIITALSAEFSMSDLGPLHHFLGVAVSPRSGGLFLSQEQYARDLLQRTGMSDCKPCRTPVETGQKLPSDAGPPVADPTEFRSIYLTFTRPDICYVVQQCCLHLHDPREAHLSALKRVLRYVKGSLSLGLLISPGSSDQLTAYSDADWVGCPDSRHSTSDYCVYLGPNLISWSSKRQPTISRSSAEAEYRAVANVIAESFVTVYVSGNLRLQLRGGVRIN
ncbi:hypothetical protein V2J09_018249 [Rumex salicifolius]